MTTDPTPPVLTAEEEAEVRANLTPGLWHGSLATDPARRLLATLDAERARAERAEAERDEARVLVGELDAGWTRVQEALGLSAGETDSYGTAHRASQLRARIADLEAALARERERNDRLEAEASRWRPR